MAQPGDGAYIPQHGEADPIKLAREALEAICKDAPTDAPEVFNEWGDMIADTAERHGYRVSDAEHFRLAEHARTALAALDAIPQPVPTFQQRCWPWLVAAFDADKGMDAQERVHRFLEEAFELAQAAGCSEADAKSIGAYVYGREPGDIRGEVGDVMNTLAALCLTHDIDMHEAADAKLADVSAPEKVARIRAKRAARVEGSPLPGFASQPAPVPADAELDALASALRSGRQADMDGVMVTVSRQACEYAADALSALRTRLAEVEGALAVDAISQSKPVTLTYRNWRGEVSDRTIVPKRIWFGSTDWHPEPGWLLTAYDLAKMADRDFALADFMGHPQAEGATP